MSRAARLLPETWLPDDGWVTLAFFPRHGSQKLVCHHCWSEATFTTPLCPSKLVKAKVQIELLRRVCLASGRSAACCHIVSRRAVRAISCRRCLLCRGPRPHQPYKRLRYPFGAVAIQRIARMEPAARHLLRLRPV